jgi:uncharacterized protein YkwD
MHPKPALRGGWRWSAVALLVLLALAGTVGSAEAKRVGVVGDCTPGADWGTLNQAYADQVLTLVNQHRTAMGLTALVVSPTLTKSATWKSLHMANYRYLAHDDPGLPAARTTADRLQTCGYPIGSVGWGENIAYGYATPDAVMTAWLNSSGHRANIENGSFRAIGIGVARSANGTYYWTQNFGTFADGGGSTAPPPAPSKPTVAFTQKPGNLQRTATFAWTTTGSPTTVTCTLDGSAVTPCTSPLTVGTLRKRGSHTFTVTATNAAGSASARHSWYA